MQHLKEYDAGKNLNFGISAIPVAHSHFPILFDDGHYHASVGGLAGDHLLQACLGRTGTLMNCPMEPLISLPLELASERHLFNLAAFVTLGDHFSCGCT